MDRKTAPSGPGASGLSPSQVAAAGAPVRERPPGRVKRRGEKGSATVSTGRQPHGMRVHAPSEGQTDDAPGHDRDPEARAPERAPRRATYRLQLHAGFNFSQAAAITGYLADLGVSHVYLSPVLQAAKGSKHGYDVVDPSAVNEELGGERGHLELQKALGAAGLGHILDVVPNHMAVASRDNRWWWDVLENGPSSVYAGYFDVDWGAPEPREGHAHSVLLLPFLADHYGRELEAGRFRLEHGSGSFTLRYYDQQVPIAPRSLDQLVSRAARHLPRGTDPAVRAEVESIGTALGRLPPSWATDRASVRERHRDKEVLRARLSALCAEHPEVETALDSETEAVSSSPDALDSLLQRQNYRLAFWRTASDEGQYRRFFDINELVGIRVEDDAVFADSHRLILRWIREGVIDGLRVDHIDGLRNPLAYLRRLEETGSGVWALVEKILARGEELPVEWPVAGTTGYDWLNLAGGLFVRDEGVKILEAAFATFTGWEEPWEDLVHDCKLQVLGSSLGSDLNRVVDCMVKVCEGHRRHSDHTEKELRDCLAEVIACYDVYRTYVVPGDKVSERDRATVTKAVVTAGIRRPEIDGELLTFLRDLLLLEITGPAETELALRFQQLTSPVTAKGVEDTAFYRYMPLLSLNEVGGDPGVPVTLAQDFHTWCARAQLQHPYGLLATSTHDTKRSEDVRARISVLSEVPVEWAALVDRWHVLNRNKRVADLPDPATEWMFYQTLVGAWPITPQRVLGFLEKAVREAKLHTSWDQNNSIYEGALNHFATTVLRSRRFVAELDAFVQRARRYGQSNSLALKLLTLTAPGVPDLYQGSELWDLSLVDPDNRRPVDYETRAELLNKASSLDLSQLWAEGDEQGLTKLALVHRALNLRARRQASFGEGSKGVYRPIFATGTASEHVVAFSRGGNVITVVTRWPLALEQAGGWGRTSVALPRGQWADVLSGGRWQGGVLVNELLSGLPVALLEKVRG
ncbi:MAG TPA: malto-oligosyltrehalose synthase [Acidimicrobiales bacterium]|nr:malto-oligosyltrehalose synthase [Acidimicrobiales bacterium]